MFGKNMNYANRSAGAGWASRLILGEPHGEDEACGVGPGEGGLEAALDWRAEEARDED